MRRTPRATARAHGAGMRMPLLVALRSSQGDDETLVRALDVADVERHDLRAPERAERQVAITIVCNVVADAEQHHELLIGDRCLCAAVAPSRRGSRRAPQ